MEGNFLSIEQAAGMYFGNSMPKPSNTGITSGAQSFENVFNEKIQEQKNVKFSKHANARLESRNISLSDEQLGRLNYGIERAKSKNINESLVMMDNIAFIVNIKNNTVVTAIDKSNDNVFTNIDGAVIV